MKKILLISIIFLLFVGCGNSFGKGADFTCSGEVTEANVKHTEIYYFYLTNGKFDKVDLEMKANTQEDAKTLCTAFNEYVKTDNDANKSIKVECGDTSIYVTNFATKDSDSDLSNYNKETMIQYFQNAGLTCK